MAFRNSTIAVVLLAGLIGFIYYYEYLGEDARESAREAESKPLVFDPDSVEGIEI